MTAVSSEGQEWERRRRYVRSKGEEVTLTPIKTRLLGTIALYGVLSLPQLARIAELTPKAARKHLRELFDAGWVEVIPIARIALAPATPLSTASSADLLYGSAPNIYRMTHAGLKGLAKRGIVEEGEFMEVPKYGPRNSYFLAHTLATKDVRAWLELSSRKRSDQTLLKWYEGERAALPLEAGTKPRCVRPDAWFAYAVGDKKLVGLVEVDRATEKVQRHWKEKIEHYRTLFGSDYLKLGTSYTNARLLVFAPSESRRDALVKLMEECAPASVTGRSWFTVQRTTAGVGLSEPVWRCPNVVGLHPLFVG